MRRFTFFVIVTVGLTASIGSAGAQSIDRPPRATGRLFGQRAPVNPTAPFQALTFTFDFYGGYDDNITEGFTGPGSEMSPQQGARVGVVEAELKYRKSRGSKFLEGTGRGFLNQTSLADHRFTGGEATFQAATDLGRRHGLLLNASAAYEPTFLFNAFGPLESQAADAVVPDATPALGITDQPWVVARALVGFNRNWTARNRTDLRLVTAQRRPVEGLGLESNSRSGLARHNWAFRRNAGLQLSYLYDDSRMSDPMGLPRPLRSHTADIGLRVDRSFSQHRRLTATFGGGATWLRAFATITDERFDYVVPSTFVVARFELGRTWAISADTRRDVTVLQGVTPEPFSSVSASVRADGIVAERLQLGVSGAFSRGSAMVSDSGSFEAAGATAQLQLILARCCSVFTTYRYYRHNLLDVLAVPSGFPPRYDRNSVQLGFTLWLPLFGNS